MLKNTILLAGFEKFDKLSSNLSSEIVTYFDDQFHEYSIEKIILPRLEITSKEGKIISDDEKLEWYDLEFAQQCVLEIKMFIRCLKIQYSDFFMQFEGVSNIAETVTKNIKSLHSLKDLIGKSGD